MRAFLESRGTVAPSAEDQRRLLEETGFVDIQVIEKCIDLGCYSQGPINLEILLSLPDPYSQMAGRLARYSLGSLWPAIGPTIVPIDDPDEKRAFIERAITELCHGIAPVALRQYPSSQLHILLILLGI